MSEDTELIATYEAVWFDGRCRFELFADSVRATGSIFLRGDFETAIPLATLQPRFERLRFRSRLFGASFGMIAAGFIGASVLITGFHLDPFSLPVGLVWGVGLSGLISCLATAHKTEFARFLTNGGFPALDIARSGSSLDFEKFVEMLVEQIQLEKSLA
jgi:hypothetical protein